MALLEQATVTVKKTDLSETLQEARIERDRRILAEEYLKGLVIEARRRKFLRPLRVIEYELRALGIEV